MISNQNQPGIGSAKSSGGGSASLDVGVTPVVNGVSGRVFFQGTGDVLQQSGDLFWDQTNSRLSIGQGTAPVARLDVRLPGVLSTDLGVRVRNSSNTGNQLEILGNNTINLFASNNNPVLNLRSNINSTFNFIDGNGTGAIIAHRHQSNPGLGSNLLSQSFNIVSYGVGGGQYGVAKINNVINTFNWSNNSQAQREGGFYVYFKSVNNFESITSTDRAFWVTPDKRVLLYNKTGNVVIGDTDAFSFYSDDIVAGNAAPHFRTENGSIIKLFQGAALTVSDGTLVNAVTRIAELEARLQAHGLIA